MLASDPLAGWVMVIALGLLFVVFAALGYLHGRRAEQARVAAMAAVLNRTRAALQSAHSGYHPFACITCGIASGAVLPGAWRLNERGRFSCEGCEHEYDAGGVTYRVAPATSGALQEIALCPGCGNGCRWVVAA